MKISTISQTFHSWVAIFHLRQSIMSLSHSSYSMSGLPPLMNGLFSERRDFHVSFSGRDMPGNVWNRPSGSSIVDMAISSNIMKSPSPKCCMTFGHNHIQWHPPLIRHFTKSWPYYRFWRHYLIPERFHRTFATGAVGNGERLLLQTPGPVRFGTCIYLRLRRFFPEVVMSTDLLTFEHPSVLLFCSWYVSNGTSVELSEYFRQRNFFPWLKYKNYWQWCSYQSLRQTW